MTPEILALFAYQAEPSNEESRDPKLIALTESAVASVNGNPSAQAGLWLYVGDFNRAHDFCQLDEQATADWHAIVHRREGDYSNARYWHRRAGTSDEITLKAASRIPGAWLLADEQAEWQELWQSSL